MTEGPPRPTPGSRPGAEVAASPDVWTIVAIGIVAYALASVIHEGLGHGGACLLAGGHPVALSSVHFECAREGRVVAAGGTVANFVAGLVFWLASRAATRATRLRYFLWLSMTINLFEAGGYFLFSGVGNIGDWAAVIQGFEPSWLWRTGLTLLGVSSYLLFVWLALLEMRPFMGPKGPERVRRAKKLCLAPYLAGGVFSCVAATFNPVGMILVGISAVAATFGGTSGLAWMWQFFARDRLPSTSFQMAPLTRSRGWMVAAAIVGALFITVVGPGVKFGAG